MVRKTYVARVEGIFPEGDRGMTGTKFGPATKTPFETTPLPPPRPCLRVLHPSPAGVPPRTRFHPHPCPPLQRTRRLCRMTRGRTWRGWRRRGRRGPRRRAPSSGGCALPSTLPPFYPKPYAVHQVPRGALTATSLSIRGGRAGGLYCPSRHAPPGPGHPREPYAVLSARLDLYSLLTARHSRPRRRPAQLWASEELGASIVECSP